MAVQGVGLEVKIRDPEAINPNTGELEVVTIQMANGTTEDGGQTVVIPAGYVPNIASVPAADIKVVLYPSPVEKVPAALVSRTDDYEANTSTLAFTFPT